MDKIKTTRQFLSPLPWREGVRGRGNARASDIAFTPSLTLKIPAAQRGVVMVFTAIAMLVLIAMAGLALDMGHAYLNKTRLQNALDAAALSGAKTLDQNPGNTLLAETAAKDTFLLVADGGSNEEPGNKELKDRVTRSDIQVQFAPLLEASQFSYPGDPNSRYVRVSVNSFGKTMFLAHVLPGVDNTMTIGGSAVAGPSPQLVEICNLLPIMLCEGDAPGEDTAYGYTIGQQYQLTSPPGNYSDVGPGNFRLIRLGGSGANIVRDNLAGGFSQCYTDGTTTIETEPGLDWGPVRQGLNTRFGDYQGGMNSADYPADTNTCQSAGEPPAGHYTHDQYSANPSCIGSPDTASNRWPGRREVAITIADCSGINTGQSTLPVAGYACAFLTRRVGQNPASGVWAEIMPDGCIAQGTPGADPGAGPGPYTIQLYQDPLSNES